MIELIKVVGQKMLENKMKNPVMQLGSDLMAGNVSQGFQNFAQNAYGPQMQLGRTMMDPNATGEQRLDAAFGVVDPRINQMMNQRQTNSQGIQSVLNTQNPYIQTLPQQGLMPYMSMMG